MSKVVISVYPKELDTLKNELTLQDNISITFHSVVTLETAEPKPIGLGRVRYVIMRTIHNDNYIFDIKTCTGQIVGYAYSTDDAHQTILNQYTVIPATNWLTEPITGRLYRRYLFNDTEGSTVFYLATIE